MAIWRPRHLQTLTSVRPAVLGHLCLAWARSSLNYELSVPYDEMFDAGGKPRPHWRTGPSRLSAAASQSELRQRQLEADKAFLTQGITFTVYGDEAGHRAHLPATTCSRASSPRRSGATTERGLAQRLTAVNHFS